MSGPSDEIDLVSEPYTPTLIATSPLSPGAEALNEEFLAGLAVASGDVPCAHPGDDPTADVAEKRLADGGQKADAGGANG
eukprot:5242328-Amphidinium_carterae.1